MRTGKKERGRGEGDGDGVSEGRVVDSTRTTPRPIRKLHAPYSLGLILSAELGPGFEPGSPKPFARPAIPLYQSPERASVEGTVLFSHGQSYCLSKKLTERCFSELSGHMGALTWLTWSLIQSPLQNKALLGLRRKS